MKDPVQEPGTETDLRQDSANIARMYDYLLGGKSNYLLDQRAAEDLLEVFPAMEVSARANRAYTHRAADHLVRRQGIRQFIDVGTGMPMTPNLHDVVQDAAPDATVVYVDSDPIVQVYADALRESTPEGTVRCVDADVTRPDDLMDAVEATGVIDFGRPAALTLHGLLHFIPDSRDPYGLVARLLQRLAPGSYLSLTHSTGDFSPAAWAAVTDTYARYGIPLQVRTQAQVLRFFEGLDFVEPGLITAHQWRRSRNGPALAGPTAPVAHLRQPHAGRSAVTDRHVGLYAGVARKP
ncbi:SAM-dependent methyltransferase [Streptomyces sp. NPDC056244]|uniref:SAM-dependent methyltransferase n=1 Tax=Streptomyces sp. NPDC056244 TaxID=3345762 RepID=UPI0035DEFB31